MIKTIVYAYWAKPFTEKNLYSNFSRKSDFLTSLKLSVSQARKWFDEIIFYGDHEAISQVCNVVSFDKVYDDLERLNNLEVPSHMWSVSKAFVCEHMDKPFLLFENDFYLWDEPSDELLNADVVVESMRDVPDEYLREINYMKEDGMTVRPRWYRFAKVGKFQIPNKGVYGGNDLKFIKEHANEVIRMTRNEQNREIFSKFSESNRYKNAHKIFDLWYCGAKFDQKKVQPYRLDDSEHKYTHLHAGTKNNDEVVLRLYERARVELNEDTPEIYDPVGGFQHYLEPNREIPNVPTSDKELSFVMVLMNRKHQLEHTLLKNLEDNWEDRDVVEFILVDVNSKDGLREWLREQDLRKYLECGYLKYYETDAMDKWHASIGKNTGVHLATGRIVVTLDCDNFTGYKGGDFVIEKFEEHDYKCVTHQFDWNPQNGNFGRIALTKKVFNQIGGYDQSLLPMGYQDWDIIKRAEGVGCEYVNPTDSEYNQAMENEGKKELSMANQKEDFKKMGWTEMNRINKLKCFHNLYHKKYRANDGYYGIRSNVRRYDADLNNTGLN